MDPKTIEERRRRALRQLNNASHNLWAEQTATTGTCRASSEVATQLRNVLIYGKAALPVFKSSVERLIERVEEEG